MSPGNQKVAEPSISIGAGKVRLALVQAILKLLMTSPSGARSRS